MSSAQNGPRPRSRTWSSLALGLMALMALAVWFHRIEFDAPSAHRTLIQSDTYRYFHPVAEFIHQEVGAGRLPLWNPYQLAGQPFLALPVNGALYPLNLVIMGLFEANTALAVHAVLHFFLAGLFTWLLAGRLGLGPAGRGAAALAYMISGPMLLGLYMSVHFSTQAWLPALLWALHGLLAEARLKWALALALFAALSFYGGYPQLFLYMAEFCGVFAVAGFFLVTPRQARLRVAGLAGLASVLALGWMMPLLLPQLEFTREASRSLDGLSLPDASTPFILTRALVEGTTRDLGDLAAGFPSGPILGRVALPALFIPLALCGLLAKGLRGYWAFFALSGLGIGLLILGPQTPAFAAYYALPLTDLFRGPIRLAFLYVFCGAMLVGIGIEGLTRFIRGKSEGRPWATVVGLVLMLLVAGDTYLRTRLISAHPSNHENARGAPAELIEFLRERPGRERIYFETHQLYAPGFLLKAGSINGFFLAGDYEPSLHRTYLDYFDWRGKGPWHGNSTVLRGDRPHAAYIDPRLLDLMGVRFYAAHQPRPVDPLPELARLFGPGYTRLGDVKVYERESALPRAYTSERVQVAADQASAMRAVKSPDFAPWQNVVVSGAVGSLPGSLGIESDARGGRPPAPSIRSSPIVSASPQEVIVEAGCDAPCLAVLTDLDYPGWQAEVDGEPAPIVRANGMFRAVALTPGKHRIVYRFEPGSFRLGLGLALLASAGAGWAWRTERKTRPL